MRPGISVAFVVVALGATCERTRDGDALVRNASLTSTASPTNSGYVHSFSKSLFNVGSGVTNRLEGGFNKTVGSAGVFAVEATTGWALAIPNGDAAVTTRPPFSGGGDAHNQQALAYFKSAGIPQDQVTGVHLNAMMSGGMDFAGRRTPDQLKGYYSVLERGIAGVRVSESKAWVRFNADGAVVEESVYWPELPATIQGDIAALRNAVAAGLGTKLKTGEVLDLASGDIWIHHSQPWDHRPFLAKVTYDVPSKNVGKGRIHSFDLGGNEVDVPSDPPPASLGAPRPAR